MELKKIIIPTIVACTVLTSAGLFLNTLNFKSKDSAGVILNETIKNEVKVDEVKKEKISVYDFVNGTLEADGFKYLGGTKWGRGEKNFFIFDLASLEFQMADYGRMNVVPDDWYISNYDKYVSLVYRFDTNKLYMMDLLKVDPLFDEKYSTVNGDSMEDPDNMWYDLPNWMTFYINQFKEYGCDIKDLTEVKLNSYKTVASKATESDVLSVFDLKSTDGVLRYFNDVHVSGKIEDSSRYIEIQSIEQFKALKEESGFQLTYLINIINSDSSKVFFSDVSKVQASIIKEFVKDFVYPNTPARDDTNKIETIGVYFINVDNLNGNFKGLYTTPEKNVWFNYSLDEFGKDFRDFSIPFEGTVVGAEKDPNTGYAFLPVNIYNIKLALAEYIDYVKLVNPNLKVSDDFLTNYSRPFAYEWQLQMGLTALFDAKYGMVDHSIQYIN